MDLALGHGGHLGQLDAIVDPQQLVGIRQLVRAHSPVVRAHDRQHVGQVVLALGVVGPDLGQRAGQRRAVKGEHPGVDLADLQLLFGRVARRLGLHHALHRPVRGPDHAPVTAGVGQDHRRDRRRRARALMSLDQRPQRRGRDQRGVAVDHHDRVLARDLVDRRPHGIGGAQRPLLHCQRHRPVERRRQPPVGPVDHHDPGGPGRPRGGHRPLDNRPAAQGVQELLHRRAHARALPCGKDDDDGRGHNLDRMHLARLLSPPFSQNPAPTSESVRAPVAVRHRESPAIAVRSPWAARDDEFSSHDGSLPVTQQPIKRRRAGCQAQW